MVINEQGVLKVYEKILRHKKKVNISIESKRIAKIFDYNPKIVYGIIKKKATEEFREEEHPRKDDGKFASKGSSSSGKSSDLIKAEKIYDKTIKGSFRILVTEDPSMLNETSNSDIMFFSSDQNEIDISPALRDSIVLERPMKEICNKDCKGLCAGCGVNLNTSNCKCKKEEMDERWAPLKEINLSEMEN